jgi:hypothetical protein
LEHDVELEKAPAQAEGYRLSELLGKTFHRSPCACHHSRRWIGRSGDARQVPAQGVMVVPPVNKTFLFKSEQKPERCSTGQSDFLRYVRGSGCFGTACQGAQHADGSCYGPVGGDRALGLDFLIAHEKLPSELFFS